MKEVLDAMDSNELIKFLRMTYPKETCYGCRNWVYDSEIGWYICDITGGGSDDIAWLDCNLKYDKCDVYEKFVY